MAKILTVLIMLLLPSLSWGASSFVKSAQGLDFGANTVAATWGSSTSAANVVACAVWWNNSTATISSVVDSVNGTLVDSGFGVARLNSAHSLQMFYKENIAGGSASTVTATFAAGATPGTEAMSCHEISGRATASALDQKNINGQNFLGTGTDFITSGSVTTTTNGQYLFCATHAQFSTDATAGTNFTIDATGTNIVFGEHLTNDQPSAGSIACTFTPAGNDGYLTGIMTFKASGGGGASAILRSLMGVGL